MISYIIFFISLLGITLLFLIKIFELEKGKIVISENIKNHLEKKTKKHLSVLCLCASHINKNTIIKTLSFVYEEIRTFTLRIVDNITKKIRNSDFKIINIISGKKVLRKDGEASAFINNIAEFKKENGFGEKEKNIVNENFKEFEN